MKSEAVPATPPGAAFFIATTTRTVTTNLRVEPDWTDIVLRARAGDEQALSQIFTVGEYRVRALCCERGYYLPGAEFQDLVQFGLIGLHEALRDWIIGFGTFWGFAQICIERELRTALQTARRRKHRVLNEAYSVDTDNKHDDDSGDWYSVLLADDPAGLAIDPALLVERRLGDESADLWEVLSADLTALERRTVEAYCLCGAEYDAAAKRLGIHHKSLDNALQRARRKTARSLRVLLPHPYWGPLASGALQRMEAGRRRKRYRVTA